MNYKAIIPSITRHILLTPFRFFGLDKQKISAYSQILIWVGLGMTAINLGNSVNDFKLYSGTDFRVRIVGSRAMLRGINPYTLDYSPQLPEILQDPDQYAKGLSRCPYPPSLLLFYLPLAPFPYPLARGLSMFLEWSALLSTIALLARVIRSQQLRSIFVIIALTLFAGSFSWRLHIERGQYHVFATFLLAWGTYEILHKRKDSWKAGIPFGLVLSMRPTVAIVLLLLLLTKFYKTTLTAIGTATIIVLITLHFGGLKFWQDWSKLVRRYEDIIVGLENLQPIKQRFPVEGFEPRKLLGSRTENSSATYVLQGILYKFNFDVKTETIKLLSKALVLGTVLLFISLFIWANFQNKIGLRFLLYSAMFISIIAEFAAPIRFGYADTQLLLLIALPLPLQLRPSSRVLSITILLGCLMVNYTTYMQYDTTRTLLVMGSNTVFYTVTVINRIRKSRENTLLLEE